MNARVLSTEAAGWEIERSRRIAATPIIDAYDRLAGVRIDERGWCHPGSAQVEPTVYILTQVLAEERSTQRAALIELEREARR